MGINYDNLNTAIAALKRCAKENENQQADTGAIRVSALCRDVADFLTAVKAERDKIQLQKIQSQRAFTDVFLSRMRCSMEGLRDVCVRLFLDKVADSDLVDVKEGRDLVSGNYIVTTSMLVGVKKGMKVEGFAPLEDFEPPIS